MNAFQKQLSQLRHRHQLVALLVFTLVAVFFWIGVSIVTSQKKSQLPANLKVLALPLVPTMDTTVLERLEQKRVITESELTAFPIFTIKPEESRRSRAASSSAQFEPITAPEIEPDSNSNPESTPSPLENPSPVPENSLPVEPSPTPATE